MSYATGHNSFMSQYLLNIYIYCRFCRLCIINVWKIIFGLSLRGSVTSWGLLLSHNLRLYQLTFPMTSYMLQQLVHVTLNCSCFHRIVYTVVYGMFVRQHTWFICVEYEWKPLEFRWTSLTVWVLGSFVYKCSQSDLTVCTTCRFWHICLSLEISVAL
jgi:hypothetical protein